MSENVEVSQGIALAIFAHPDDIEFCCAGTLALLRKQGYAIHCWNLASGSCGSMTGGPEATAETRWREAQASAKVLGATMHEPLFSDLEIFYNDESLRRVSAVLRTIQPDIVLTHAVEDYMEDHMETARLALSALFSAPMPHYRTQPDVPPYDKPRALYHALPHGLHRPQDGTRAYPRFYVNVDSVMDEKRRALGCHESQKSWLDDTQAMDCFVDAMDQTARALGSDTGRSAYAEGFTQHGYIGLGDNSYQPIQTALSEYLTINTSYPQSPLTSK